MFESVRSYLFSENLWQTLCLTLRPDLFWPHAISDGVIAASYLSIPACIGYYKLRTKAGGSRFGWLPWCFVAFISWCGVGHGLRLAGIWINVFGIEVIVHVITAMVSAAVAGMLWWKMPVILSMPTRAEMASANDALHKSMQEKLFAEEALRHAHKMEALGHVTGGMAHDFNNILAAVILNLDRATRNLEGADPKIVRSITNALRAAEKGAALTNHMLAFARKQPDQDHEFDVNQVIREFESLLCDAAGEGRYIVLRLDDAPLFVFADKQQLETALVNLVVNARDALHDGGDIVISTHAEVTDDGRKIVVLEVSDRGVGMDKETAKRAFEPFFTTKQVGDGAGLGLAQVFGFTKQTGGSVELDSVVSRGTRVRMKIPARWGDNLAKCA